MVDSGNGLVYSLVYRTLKLKFEYRQVPCVHLHARGKRTRQVESLAARSLFHRDGMLRCCISRLQRPSHVLRILCVFHLSCIFARFVHRDLAFIPQHLMMSVAHSPKHWVLDSPCPPVQFLESRPSVVSSRPQILRGALLKYALLVLSASSTSARMLEGC